MVRWLAILVRTLRSTIRTQRELALENLALRQQVAVWKVRRPRPQLTATDRLFWVVLSRLWKNWRSSLQVVRPGPWCGGTVRASGATGHGRVHTDGVGPRLPGVGNLARRGLKALSRQSTAATADPTSSQRTSRWRALQGALTRTPRSCARPW